ncbi:hypothetical protein TVH25_20255 [Rhodococcus sp. 7Tela_A2]|uniref:hypothetical protein n=1 Tax=Rhodococcus sp. 7Tela_A2 TaxID=3093744 RepID=UPI003BB75A23
MTPNNEKAPDAVQGIEGFGSHPYQRAEAMFHSSRPTAYEITEAANTTGVPELNVTHALAVWIQLRDIPDAGYTREEWLEVAINRLAALEGASL